MDRSSALAKLATLTAGLKPAGTSTLEDLNAARAALAGSLLAHAVDPVTATTALPAPPAASPSSEDLRALHHVLETATAVEPGAPVPLVFRRTLPAITVGNPALTPVAVAGMRPQSIGPFADSLGALHWFDIFPPVQQTAISRAPSATPFLLLPLALPAGPVPKALSVASGTVWIEAQLLAPSSPAGGYAGFAISGGTLTFSNTATASAAGIDVTATTTVTLTVTLDGPAGPTGGGEPGADGGAVVANLPAQVTFVFSLSGAAITAAGDASLIAFGSTIGLKFAAEAPVFESSLGQILVPFAPQSATFVVQSVHSDVVTLHGTAPVVGAAWALPVAVTPPAQLGAAANAGLLVLVLGRGLVAGLQGSTGGPASLAAVFLECAGGMLALLARIHGAGRLAVELDLWPNAPPSTARSTIDVSFPNNTLLYYTSVSSFAGVNQVDIVSCGALLAAHIDRPVAADGSRLGPSLPGTLAIYQTASLNGVLIAGLAPATPSPPPPIALALRNALLVTTPPSFLLMAGSFSATIAEVDAGGLLLAFGIERLLPTLPDPYAANFLPLTPNTSPNQPVVGEATTAPTSLLLATVLWSPTLKTTLAFSAQTLTPNSLQVQRLFPTQEPQPFGQTGEQDLAWQSQLESILDNTLGSESPQLYLLDVSSHVDQLGVGLAVTRRDIGVLANAGREALSIAGLDLVAPTQDLRVMTVPAVQWEPVVTIQNSNVLPYPFPSPAGFLDDGGPTLWGANDVTLVPVAPAPLFQQVITSYDEGKAAGALFTLPFGMAAVVAIPEGPELILPWLRRPGLTPVQPSFTPQNMSGGLQMSLTAPITFFKTADSPALPGAIVQKLNLVDQSGNPAGGTPLSVLGPAVDNIFNSEFQPGAPGALVPLERIDFSGYGASSFSDWTAPDAIPPAVVQVSFKMLVGRTSHEVVQVKSVLYPWGAIVVRTITIDRQDNSTVNRYDSGWIAATPGVFQTTGITVHSGAVIGAYNIREISDTTQTYKPGGGLEMVGVYFDADIQIDGVLSGGSNGRVPSARQFGFIQTEPAGTPLTAAELADLISSQGSLGGPVNCVISLAGTAQTMRLTRVEVDNAPHPGAVETHEFAATARGSVVLPQPGSWSVLQRTDSVGEPTPIDPDLGVPLIREGPAAGGPSTSAWRLAEPVDLWVPDSPSLDYCLLHATDSTRMLFPRPQIAYSASAFTSDQVPLLADGFALMGATSICPRQDSCLTFPDANYALQISGSGAFTLANVPASFPPSVPSRTLASASAGAIGFEYADDTGAQAQVSAAISPTSWSVGLQGINTRIDIGPFTGLMRTVGDVNASSGSGVAFHNGKLVLGSVLEPLQALLSFLAKLGLPNPLSLAFSNSGWTSNPSYKLKAGLTFQVPSIYLPVLWIFLKQPTDNPPGVMPFSASLSLKLGFGNAISGPAAQAGALLTSSTQWSSYLSITGIFQWEVWPPFPVKVGFLLGFTVQISFAPSGDPGSTQLIFQLGGIISIGGNLGPFLSASASVSVVFSLVITESTSTSVTLGLALIISVSAKVLSGLVGISFTAEAGGAFTLTSPQSFQATFSVSVDVQVCWVLDVSFDASIQFSHQLSA
jgi:hypothetical protein